MCAKKFLFQFLTLYSSSITISRPFTCICRFTILMNEDAYIYTNNFFPTIEEDSSNLLTKHTDHYQPSNRFFFGAKIQGTTLFSKHVLLSYLLSMISFYYTSLYSQLQMVTPGCFGFLKKKLLDAYGNHNILCISSVLPRRYIWSSNCHGSLHKKWISKSPRHFIEEGSSILKISLPLTLNSFQQIQHLYVLYILIFPFSTYM